MQAPGGTGPQSLEAKIVVLGSQGVGKTCVVVRYVGRSFNKLVSPTIGASFFTCKMALDNYRVKLQVWDTAGQERFRSMAPMYYRKANAAFIVYDITSPDSFSDMQNWVHELKKNVPTKMVLCVLGNKCDLRAERKVSLEDAQEYANHIGAKHFETSAVTNEGVEEAFVHVAHQLIKLHESEERGTPMVDSNSFALKPASNSSVPVHEAPAKGGCCS